MVRRHPPGWVSNRKATAIRVAAVICVIMAQAVDGKPTKFFKDKYPEYAKTVREDHGSFLKRRHNNFMKNGTVADSKRRGRPPNVPKWVAVRASEIFKQGYIVYARTTASAKTESPVHLWWTSIDAACKQNTTLRDICQVCSVSPKTLLKHMKEHDPNLVRRRIATALSSYVFRKKDTCNM